MENLQELRYKIDDIDTQIIHLLAKRCSIVQNIWLYKKSHNLPLWDQKRQKELLQANVDRWQDVALSREFIIDLRERIHSESLNIQQ